MKRILIIGSSGFIGSALEKKLKDENYDLFSFNLNNGDISKKKSLDAFEDIGIDHVFNLAARTSVPDSWINPYDFYQVNFMGTLNVLEFCRRNNCKLTIASSYLYGNPQYLPIDEEHPLEAYNPYAQSKLFSELNCLFYQKNFSISISILRIFNAYGPGQPSQFLIPTILDQLYDNKMKEIVVNDLEPMRDYVYIDDIIEALALTIKNPPGIYNVASGTSISVKEIIDKLASLSGISKSVKSSSLSRKNEIFNLYGNISKINNELGWCPKYDIERGLAKCIQFYEGKR